MGYKLKRILIYPDGVTEKQVYPKYEWKPDTSRTLLYLPLESNATDQSGNSRSTSSSNVSYTTVGGLASASIPSNGYITIPDNMVSYSMTQKTVSCLIYVSSTSSSTRRNILHLLKNGVSYTQIMFKENTTYIQDITGLSSSIIINTPNNSYPANQWFHYCCTYDSTGSVVYINGVQVATGTGTSTPRGTKSNTTNDSCRIGNSNTGSQGLAGNIREMILEKKKRSDEDVSKYYQRIKSKLGI